MNKVKLPEGWKWVKLGDTCKIVSGHTPKGLEQNSNKGDCQFYKVSDMNLVGNEVRMNVSNIKLTIEEISNLKIKIYPKGTVIFPKRGGAILTNKKRLLSQDASFDLNVMGILPNEKVTSNYLFYWFQKLDLSKIYDGSNVPQINNKNVNPLDFPLPLVETQQAIVYKIEELFSELDKGIEDLKTAQQQLKIYRQSVLKWAFEGKLTDGKNKISTIPFGSIIKVVSGNTPKGLENISNSGNCQFYKVSDMNLVGNEIEMRTSKFNLTLTDIEKLKIKLYPKGTIIFPKRGGAILTNKKRKLSKESAFDLNVMGALPNEKVDANYLFYWFQKLDLGKICDGSNVPQINNKNIEPLDFQICGIEEQHLIVQEIESRLSVADKMEESIAQRLLQAEVLRQSILKKAFSGELV